jgi:hypothetical protein
MTRVYRLVVEYPPRSREPGWEPPGWEPVRILGESESFGEYGEEFRWPANRLCLSAATASRRAQIFRKYGAEVTVERSEPVTWPPAVTP